MTLAAYHPSPHSLEIMADKLTKRAAITGWQPVIWPSIGTCAPLRYANTFTQVLYVLDITNICPSTSSPLRYVGSLTQFIVPIMQSQPLRYVGSLTHFVIFNEIILSTVFGCQHDTVYYFSHNATLATALCW